MKIWVTSLWRVPSHAKAVRRSGVAAKEDLFGWLALANTLADGLVIKLLPPSTPPASILNQNSNGFALAPIFRMPEATVVYILQSERDLDRYYTGRTTDLPKRLAAHDGGFSVHTADGRPWRVIVSIAFADEKKAAAFESYLKSGSGRAFANRHFR